MNKLEIHTINGYCHTISDLCNEINYMTWRRRYIASFDTTPLWWDIYVRRQDSSYKFSMQLSDAADYLKSDERHNIVHPTPENFELAIEMLQECLKEMQEEEAVS